MYLLYMYVYIYMYVFLMFNRNFLYFSLCPPFLTLPLCKEPDSVFLAPSCQVFDAWIGACWALFFPARTVAWCHSSPSTRLCTLPCWTWSGSCQFISPACWCPSGWQQNPLMYQSLSISSSRLLKKMSNSTGPTVHPRDMLLQTSL